MTSAVQLIILALSISIALGGSLQWDISEKIRLDVSTESYARQRIHMSQALFSPKDKRENNNILETGDLDLEQLMSGLLDLSEDDYKMLLDEVWQAIVRHQHQELCEGDTCKLCLKHLPFIGRICFEIEYVKSPAGIHLVLTRGGKEILCITFPNETPKICLFHHICAQVVDININNGELCASFEFNGVTVIKDHCLDI